MQALKNGEDKAMIKGMKVVRMKHIIGVQSAPVVGKETD